MGGVFASIAMIISFFSYCIFYTGFVNAGEMYVPKGITGGPARGQKSRCRGISKPPHHFYL
jgi:hypothetical protein